MAELICPPLGTGSVDFDALNAAAKKAKSQDDLAKAVETATARVEAPAEQPTLNAAPAAEPGAA
jgi:hypothetical protein